MGDLQVSYARLELVASVFVAFEKVEAGTAGAEQYGLAFLGHFIGSLHTVCHALDISDGKSEAIEESV